MQNGSCLCGNVKIEITGEAKNVRICHCRLCQKTMGAPFLARALFPQDNILVNGETQRHSSSDGLDRVFCPTCGTTLGAWRKNGTFAGIALAIFDNRNAFEPTEHIWVSEKMEWVKISDNLPQYPKGKP